jgi:hypothetical protein
MMDTKVRSFSPLARDVSREELVPGNLAVMCELCRKLDTAGEFVGVVAY